MLPVQSVQRRTQEGERLKNYRRVILLLASLIFTSPISARPFSKVKTNLENCESPMKIVIEDRKNLSFTTSSTSMDRENENFELATPPIKIREAIEQTICSTIKFIDKEYLPDELFIQLEHSAQVQSPNYSELIPTSLVLSQQIPIKNSIRLSLYELENDRTALNSILAHEVGHMLMEWIARRSNVTDSSQEVIHFWSKPIYEGIADFTSACVTGQTLIGSRDLWFGRDILQYNSLEDAKNPTLSMAESIKIAFNEIGLIPKYQFYRNWLSTVEQFLKDANIKDPYSEGTWVAGQLWKMSNSCTDKRIWSVLSKFAESGEPFSDSAEFIQAVNKNL